MAQTTGPVLAMGAITLANRSIFNNQPVDWKIPIATGLLAGMMALMEKAAPTLATGLVYIGLFTVTLTRVEKDVPSPAESMLTWWSAGPGK